MLEYVRPSIPSKTWISRIIIDQFWLMGLEFNAPTKGSSLKGAKGSFLKGANSFFLEYTLHPHPHPRVQIRSF